MPPSTDWRENDSTHHPELLPLVQHFSRSVSELSETTLVAAGAMLGNGITKCAKEMEV